MVISPWQEQGDWQSIGGSATPQQIKAVSRFATSKNRTLIASEIRRTIERGGHFFEGVDQPINPREKPRTG